MSATNVPQKQGRRPKNLPKLPLSAFSAPNTGTSETFPLPLSPSAVHPDTVIDANVIVKDGDVTLAHWRQESGLALGNKQTAIVVFLSQDDLPNIDKIIQK